MDRRQFFGSTLSIVGGVVAASAAAPKSLASLCGITPRQTEGPFYPVKDQPDKDSDLTYVNGKSAQALGERIIVQGVVNDQNCNPVSGVLVEIWQACASGRYNHPQDTNPAPLDPNFQYWGKAITNSKGEYSFKTIIPGQYPADVDWVRPPHIHFKLAKLGYHELITQMYFEGHQLNSKDRILQDLSASAQKQVTIPLITGKQGERSARFDITIRRAK